MPERREFKPISWKSISEIVDHVVTVSVLRVPGKLDSNRILLRTLLPERTSVPIVGFAVSVNVRWAVIDAVKLNEVMFAAPVKVELTSPEKTTFG